MTLLIGTVFPWSDLLERLNPPLVRGILESGPRGVIVVADSRWTYPSGESEDGAVKVFGVHENGVAGYAGLAIAGEEAMKALSADEPVFEAPDEWCAWAENTVRDAWQSHQPNDAGLEVVYGFSFESGAALLWRFSSRSDFKAQLVNDRVVVGPEAARIHFEQALRAATIQTFSAVEKGQTALSLGIDSWATLIVAVVNDVVKFESDPTVGGKLLCTVSIIGKNAGRSISVIGPDGKYVDTITLGRGGKTQLDGVKFIPPEA